MTDERDTSGPVGLWTTFAPRRAFKAAALAIIGVPAIGFVAKWVIESTTDLVYELHWESTIPMLMVLFFFVLNRLLNEYALGNGQRSDAAGGGPSTPAGIGHEGPSRGHEGARAPAASNAPDDHGARSDHGDEVDRLVAASMGEDDGDSSARAPDTETPSEPDRRT